MDGTFITLKLNNMKLPKFYRKYVYKCLLKRYREWYALSNDDHFVCHEIRAYFPYVSIKSYPELYEMREMGSAYYNKSNKYASPHSKVWFENNYERIKFLELAIKLCNY